MNTLIVGASLGGLRVAEALRNLGFAGDIDILGDLSIEAKLFAESHSRFVVSVNPRNRIDFEKIFSSKAYFLGTIDKLKELKVTENDKEFINITIDKLENGWKTEF